MRQLQKCEIKYNHLNQSLSELKFAKHEISGQLAQRETKEKDYLNLAQKYEHVIQASEMQIQQLTLEKDQSASESGLSFSNEDKQRLLQINKQLNQINFEVQEKQLQLSQIQATRDS